MVAPIKITQVYDTATKIDKPNFKSSGLKRNRIQIDALNDPIYKIAVENSTIFKNISIHEGWVGLILRVLGLRNWVVLNVTDGKDEGFIKVNAESLRKRLGITSKQFNTHLIKSLDFSDEVKHILEVQTKTDGLEQQKLQLAKIIVDKYSEKKITSDTLIQLNRELNFLKREKQQFLKSLCHENLAQSTSAGSGTLAVRYAYGVCALVIFDPSSINSETVEVFNSKGEKQVVPLDEVYVLKK